MATLNIIGAGRVGATLGNLIVANRVLEIGDVCDRDAAHAAQAVDFIGAGSATGDIAAMRPADIWLLSVPDMRIADVADALAKLRKDDAPSIAVHCSGALDTDTLASLRAIGWSVASAHPMLSFANPGTAVFQFEGTPCGFEGDPSARAAWSGILEAIGARCFDIEPGSKALYHAAAVVASNFLPVLAAMSVEMWQAAGIPPPLIEDMMHTLSRNAVANVVSLGPKDALTGPAARGDRAVVEAQSQAMGAWDAVSREAYDALSTLAARLASTGKVRDA
ncbi:coenzyme F420-dependent NADP oxidoreductase [Caballeronia hypogeia]|uniref:Coenzyme F420-dependent NADP oxidoreductase n=1 Tax=Caballeronia hypogeia TaxID=1777140 RepID=A0A158DSH3_9BURK|nr:Rossmann-like and DUF2520 domain-containing protein [Caballeronia hypogeia]SAK96677.1 coenzyme F420-dependent NADP oxidoreductase [Caballeronia hypogeia]